MVRAAPLRACHDALDGPRAVRDARARRRLVPARERRRGGPRRSPAGRVAVPRGRRASPLAGHARPRDPRPQRLPVGCDRDAGRDGRRDRGACARPLRVRAPRGGRRRCGRGRERPAHGARDAGPYARAPCVAGRGPRGAERGCGRRGRTGGWPDRRVHRWQPDRRVGRPDGPPRADPHGPADGRPAAQPPAARRARGRGQGPPDPRRGQLLRRRPDGRQPDDHDRRRTVRQPDVPRGGWNARGVQGPGARRALALPDVLRPHGRDQPPRAPSPAAAVPRGRHRSRGVRGGRQGGRDHRRRPRARGVRRRAHPRRAQHRARGVVRVVRRLARAVRGADPARPARPAARGPGRGDDPAAPHRLRAGHRLARWRRGALGRERPAVVELRHHEHAGAASRARCRGGRQHPPRRAPADRVGRRRRPRLRADLRRRSPRADLGAARRGTGHGLLQGRPASVDRGEPPRQGRAPGDARLGGRRDPLAGAARTPDVERAHRKGMKDRDDNTVSGPDWWLQVNSLWWYLTIAPEYPPDERDERDVSVFGLALPARATVAILASTALILVDQLRLILPGDMGGQRGPLGLTYLTMERFLLFLVVPVLIIVLGFRDRVGRYGLKLGIWRWGLGLLVVGIVVMTPIILTHSGRPEFRSYYGASGESLGAALTNHLFELIPAEFLLRGFLMFALW